MSTNSHALGQSPLFVAWIASLYGFLLAPLLFVILVSFSAGSVPSFPPEGWSLRWYVHALTLDLFLRGMATSCWLALVATMIATPIGTAAALGIARGNFPGRNALQAFLMTPLIVPALVIGIALLVSTSAIDFRDSAFRLVVGHVIIVMPYSIRTVLASVSPVDLALEEAARTMGAREHQVFWHVTLPLIRPGIFAGMIMAFIMSFDDVAASLFLVDSRNNTLPIAILSYLEYNYDPSIAAISALLIIITVGAAIVLERLIGLRRALGL